MKLAQSVSHPNQPIFFHLLFLFFTYICLCFHHQETPSSNNLHFPVIQLNISKTALKVSLIQPHHAKAPSSFNIPSNLFISYFTSFFYFLSSLSEAETNILTPEYNILTPEAPSIPIKIEYRHGKGRPRHRALVLKHPSYLLYYSPPFIITHNYFPPSIGVTAPTVPTVRLARSTRHPIHPKQDSMICI